MKIKSGSALFITLFSEITPETVRDFEDMDTDISEIILVINCTGGDLFAAEKINGLLKDHPAHKRGLVVSYCGSAAVVPLLACDDVSMPENALLTFHPVAGAFAKDTRMTAEQMRAQAARLDEHAEIVPRCCSEGSGIEPERIAEMMRDSVVLTGAEALEIGFIDATTPAVVLVPKKSGDKKE